MDIIEQYWDNQPCHIKHSDKPFGTREYFDEIEEKRYFVEPHLERFAQFPRWTGKRVLEIGCGIGTDAINFMQWGAHYTGIDLSNKSIEICKQRADVYDVHGTFLHMNAENLAGVDLGRFDLVYSIGVIHHANNPIKILNAIPYKLDSGGVFKGMFYAKNSIKAALIRQGLVQTEAQDGVPVAHMYTIEELKNLLQNAGLFVESINQTFIFPWVIEEYIKNIYVKEPWVACMPKDIFAALERELGWHLLVEAI